MLLHTCAAHFTLYAIDCAAVKSSSAARAAVCFAVSGPTPAHPTMTNTPCPTTFTPMYHIPRRPSAPRLQGLDDMPTQIINHTQQCRRFSGTNQSWRLHELQGNQIRENVSQIQMACNSATTVARHCTPLSYRRALKLHADVAGPPENTHSGILKMCLISYSGWRVGPR